MSINTIRNKNFIIYIMYLLLFSQDLQFIKLKIVVDKYIILLYTTGK